jgi:hypothetical protein
LRAVASTDGMAADSYQFDVKLLDENATRIANEVKGVSWVAYGVASKPPQVRESRDVPHRSCGHCPPGASADLETVPARGKSAVDAGSASGVLSE